MFNQSTEYHLIDGQNSSSVLDNKLKLGVCKDTVGLWRGRRRGEGSKEVELAKLSVASGDLIPMKMTKFAQFFTNVVVTRGFNLLPL